MSEKRRRRVNKRKRVGGGWNYIVGVLGKAYAKILHEKYTPIVAGGGDVCGCGGGYGAGAGV